jgi:hypothetical protein
MAKKWRPGMTGGEVVRCPKCGELGELSIKRTAVFHRKRRVRAWPVRAGHAWVSEPADRCTVDPADLTG